MARVRLCSAHNSRMVGLIGFAICLTYLIALAFVLSHVAMIIRELNRDWRGTAKLSNYMVCVLECSGIDTNVILIVPGFQGGL